MSEFAFDVFLSHSSKDKPVVRDIAERLRADGLRVWFDEWILKPGDHVHAKIEEGLEQSRVLVLCMSANAFGSDWAQLESYTFRFRDPLNKELRFIPVRLDDTPIKAALAHFLYIKWGEAEREQEYPKLLEACRPPAVSQVAETPSVSRQRSERSIDLDYGSMIYAYAFSADGKRALTAAVDRTVRLWDVETGRKLYLQLKSGDSYLRKQRNDGTEVFRIQKERHARYWMEQAFPVLLVIRNAEGEVRWMEVRDWLKRASDGGKKTVKQIVFEGERLDVMAVRRLRDRALGSN